MRAKGFGSQERSRGFPADLSFPVSRRSGKGLEPADLDFREEFSSTIEGRSVFWVPNRTTGNQARRGKGDATLYGRGVGGEVVPFVECGSCHDPHTSSDDTFMRIPEGSDLCLTCHEK